MNWNELAPTTEAWAQALAVLIERAQALNTGDPEGRNTLIDELTEFIVCSPPFAGELDKLAADAVDDLLAAEISARLSQISVRARALAGHSAGLGTAASPNTTPNTTPNKTPDATPNTTPDATVVERGGKRS